MAAGNPSWRAPEDWAYESPSPRPATGKKAGGLKRLRVSLTNSDVGKDFTYDLPEEINRQLVASEADKSAPTVNDEDKQGRLAYDDSDAREEHDPQAA